MILGYFLPILLVVLVIGFLGWMLLWAIDNDSWPVGLFAVLLFLFGLSWCFYAENQESRRPFDGYVATKTYFPAHTEMIFTGKVVIPVQHPERWNVVVRNDQDRRSCDVSHEVYESLQLGDPHHCGE